MKKLKTLASLLCMFFLATAANAGTKIGINAAYTMFSSSGSETLRQSNNVTNKTVDEDIIVPSLWTNPTMAKHQPILEQMFFYDMLHPYDRLKQ